MDHFMLYDQLILAGNDRHTCSRGWGERVWHALGEGKRARPIMQTAGLVLYIGSLGKISEG